MKEELIKYMENLLEYLVYCNRMAPFPVYDTEYVFEVRKFIEDMKKRNKYDDDPVTSCKYCFNLATIVDEVENDVCTRCGSVNELRVFEDIIEYLKVVKHSETDESD
tara:strand:- start:11201 stop:11521 length:321 start_codon:yes stop_codon:yes gene_type:complete